MVWDFLREAVRVRPETLKKVRVILGNEACDLDSAVCAIVYSYLLNCIAELNNDMGKVIPVLNIPKEDFALKTEVAYFLQKYDVPIADLHFRNTINLDVLRSSSALELILVDHHTLSQEDIWLKPYVIEVIDHRPQDPDWTWQNIKKTISMVGSCSTLIAEIAISQNAFPIPNEVLQLLYGAILLDTGCMSENPKKYTDRDVAVLEELEKRLIPNPGRDTVYNELLSVRCNITGLTIPQILRKDMKVVSDIPVCSLPVLVKDFLLLTDAFQELEKFAFSYAHKAIIVLGFSGAGPNFKRELAVFAYDNKFLTVLADSLISSQSPNLQLQGIDIQSASEKLKVFHQCNTHASRKQVLPIVKQAVINYKSTVSAEDI